MKVLHLLLAAAVFAPLPLLAQSQAAGGSIEGTVTDDSGAVLPGATVTVKNTATGLTRETPADASGRFRAPLLPVGDYEVSVSLQGFATTKRRGLTLNIGQTLDVDVTLKVASAQEEITVTAEAPLLEVTRSQQSSVVNERAVANLPVNGRNFIDFVLTTPGVIRDPRGGDISFAGQRGTLNSLVIDGADNNNTFFGQTLGRTGSGRAPYQFSQDAVQEFQVNRNAYSAEYGRAGGAVINVVTKSGTNDFHGSAFEFFRDKSLNANSYNNKIRTPIAPRSPFRIHQFGGSLGGPLQRDRAFFFLSYDGQRQTIPNTIPVNLPAGLPTDADTQRGLALVQAQETEYPSTRDQDVLLAKVDYQLSQKHRLSLRYNHQNFTGGNNESTSGSLDHSGDSLVRTRTFNASLSSVMSPTFYNEFRAQSARDKEPGLANSELPEVTVRQGGQTVLVFGRNFFSPRETTIKRWQVADTVTLIRGAHAWKVGADFNHDDILNFFPGNFGGRYTFNSLASLGRGVPDGVGESFQQAFAGLNTTGATTTPNITEFAAFLQDEWRASKALTLSFGLRYDLQSFEQPTVKNPDAQLAAAGIDTSFMKTDRNNIGPRLGFAWNPRPGTVVRGGYGIFYGRTPSIMVGTAHSGNAINVQTITFTGSQVPPYPGTFTSPPAGANPPKPSISVFANDFENPMVHQASLGLEHRLTDNLAFAASYLFVKGTDLPRSNDFNVGDPVATPVPIQGGGALTVQRFPSVRPFANFDRIVRYESTADSRYNGVTLELRRPFRGRFQASLAYTLGKVTDTVPDATNVVLGGGDDARFQSNPKDFEADRAAGNADARHRAVFSGLWDMSYFRESSPAVKALLGDWSVSWIAAVQSGQPYSERVTNDLNNDGNRSNDLVPGSRNSHRLPTSYNVDARLSRKVRLGNQAGLELIAEAFNLLNTTNITAQRDTLYNFATVNGVATLVPQQNLSNPRLNFGADSSTQINFADTQRIVQLAVKFTF
jgi:outer membrane receptor protein involved in Fe transport